MAKASLGVEQRHEALPELRGDFKPSVVVFEHVEPCRASVAFLEGHEFGFDDSHAREDAIFIALAQGCSGDEEAFLGAGNHGLLLDAAQDILLNPAHPDFSNMSIDKAVSFDFGG